MISNHKTEKAFIALEIGQMQQLEQDVSTSIPVLHHNKKWRFVIIPKTCEDVACQSSSIDAGQKSTKTVPPSNVKFLGRQSLPIRGTGDENDSNYTQLYFLRKEDNPYLKTWCETKKNDKYVHHDV